MGLTKNYAAIAYVGLNFLNLTEGRTVKSIR